MNFIVIRVTYESDTYSFFFLKINTYSQWLLAKDGKGLSCK